jgi:hypothetical protein
MLCYTVSGDVCTAVLPCPAQRGWRFQGKHRCAWGGATCGAHAHCARVAAGFPPYNWVEGRVQARIRAAVIAYGLATCGCHVVQGV